MGQVNPNGNKRTILRRIDMSNIIIHKSDTISDYDALSHIQSVIRQGRVSRNGECYAFVTEFYDGFIVYADKKKADIFTVTQRPMREKF